MNMQIDKLLAQQIVNTVKDVCGYNINFIDCSGIIYASTDEKRIGTYHEIGQKAAASKKVIEVDTDTGFTGTQKGVNLPIFYHHSVVAVIGISGNPNEVGKYAHLAERITNLLIREKEWNAFSRSEEEKKHHIILSLLGRVPLDSAGLEETLSRWNIDLHSHQRMLLLQRKAGHAGADSYLPEQDIVHLLNATGAYLYTYRYPGEYLAVLDRSAFLHGHHYLEDFAAAHPDGIKIAVGKETSFDRLADSYDSCRTVLKSLRASGTSSYATFDSLTLEILLSDISSQSRDVYLKKTISALSDEDIRLITAYFEEEQSLNRTCLKLFLHKNTLQYRLDRIHRKTGYNPRTFKDGMLLYLALRLR